MMKKNLLAITFAFIVTALSAQTETENKITFNKWSIELAGGAHAVSSPFTSGYYSAAPGLFTVDLGARYMFNNKFGLKADFGFNNIDSKSNSKDFNTKYYRFDVQGVTNLGRIMNFETWTRTIGLLGHGGLGVGYLDGDHFTTTDYVGNIMGGLTAQIKLSNKIVLTGDATAIFNSKQNHNFDGIGANPESRGFSGRVFTATLGLTFYLGHNENHADWTVDNRESLELAALKEKVAKIEDGMQDTDRDGVSNYIDEEPNTMSGVLVNTKGKAVDLNKNGIPDELDRYMEDTYQKKGNNEADGNALIKKLIDSGYVCAYFDNNSSVPTAFSTNGIEFILVYLRNYPSATIDIIGHTDEIGTNKANDKLSLARANSVKNILVKAKVDPSRLNVVAAGENNSVDAKNADARKLVRTVTFTVK